MFEYENNNFCEISGRVIKLPEYSHNVNDERFFKFTLSVKRLSGTYDYINAIISEKYLDKGFDLNEDTYVSVKGQFRSYNNYSGLGNKLILSVFVKEISIIENENEENTNYISLVGYLCKEPVYRITPFGREITDILLAVNRIHNKSDYLPCILWGMNAKEASELHTGDKLMLTGRIQSREYKKKIDENNYVTKTAYEVSVSRLEKIEQITD